MHDERPDLLDKLKTAAGRLDLTDPDAVSRALGVVLVEREINHTGGRREFEATGDGPVRGVELLLLPRARGGHEATLSLNLDPEKIGGAELKTRFGDLMVANLDYFDISGYPHPVLHSVGFRVEDHRLFIDTRIDKDPERLKAIGLMQLVEVEPREIQPGDPIAEPPDDFLEELLGAVPPPEKGE